MYLESVHFNFELLPAPDLNSLKSIQKEKKTFARIFDAIPLLIYWVLFCFCFSKTAAPTSSFHFIIHTQKKTVKSEYSETKKIIHNSIEKFNTKKNSLTSFIYRHRIFYKKENLL